MSPPGATAAVGGRRAALEAIRAGRAREVLVAEGSRVTEGLRTVLEAAGSSGVAVRRVDRAKLDSLRLPNDQGVAAFVVPPPELDDRSFAARDLPGDALVVVLDGIEDPQNFGACARSAEAAGAAMLVVRSRRAAPTTPSAIRASAGALLHLPVARVTNLARALDRLRDRGFGVVGLDAEGIDLRRAPMATRPLALVIGSEGSGLSRLVRERCELLVSIPMLGRTASLNASAALAVGLFGYVLVGPPQRDDGR